MTASVAPLDMLSSAGAADALRSCCGASAWVSAMLARRPFRTREAVLRAADEVWATLEPADWLEAFAHHPRIGERRATADVTRGARAWSATEQSGVDAATRRVRDAIAEGNRAYEQRFGFIFLICASGLSAEEMLGALERRLRNAPDAELRVAAEEQRKITRLRLEKLMSPSTSTRGGNGE